MWKMGDVDQKYCIPDSVEEKCENGKNGSMWKRSGKETET